MRAGRGFFPWTDMVKSVRFHNPSAQTHVNYAFIVLWDMSDFCRIIWETLKKSLCYCCELGLWKCSWHLRDEVFWYGCGFWSFITDCKSDLGHCNLFCGAWWCVLLTFCGLLPWVENLAVSKGWFKNKPKNKYNVACCLCNQFRNTYCFWITVMSCSNLRSFLFKENILFFPSCSNYEEVWSQTNLSVAYWRLLDVSGIVHAGSH